MTRPLTRLVLLVALALYGSGFARYVHNQTAHASQGDVVWGVQQCGHSCNSQPQDGTPAQSQTSDCAACFMLATGGVASPIASAPFVAVVDPTAGPADYDDAPRATWQCLPRVSRAPPFATGC